MQDHSRIDPERLRSLVDGFGDRTVLAVGDFYLDEYVLGSVAGASPEMPVLRILEERREWAPGAAGNVAVNLACLGCRVKAFGVVGGGSHGEILRQRLVAFGVDCTHLIADSTRLTGSFTRFLTQKPGGGTHHLLRLDRENTAPVSTTVQEQLASALAQALKECDGVFLADYDETPSRNGLLQPHLVRTIGERAKSGGAATFAMSRLHLSEYSSFDYLFCNLKEAQLLGLQNESDLESFASQAVRSMNLSGLCVTLGERGVVCAGSDEFFRTAADYLRAVDTCGAGDSFAAAFSLAILSGSTLSEAATLGVRAAGLSVAKPGTQPVHRYELSERLGQSSGRSEHKIVTREELLTQLEKSRSSQRIVFTNGYFDIIHPGHLHLLSRAKEAGDLLVVGINSDRSTTANKGHGRPILKEADRAQILASVEAVDFVTVFDELTPISLIREIRPQVLVKGGNYQPDEVVGKDIVEAYGGKVVVLPRWGGFTSTSMIRSMKKVSDGMREE